MVAKGRTTASPALPSEGKRPCGYCGRLCYGKHGWHYDRDNIEVCWRCNRAFLRLTREGRA